jgi:hypothetical protein
VTFSDRHRSPRSRTGARLAVPTVRAGSSAAIDLEAYDRWSGDSDPDPTEPLQLATCEDGRIRARGSAIPAPVTLAPATLAPSELELDDTESIPMDGHLPTVAEHAQTVDTGQILEMFVDPTEGLERSRFSSYERPVTVSRVESMCLPSQAEVSSAHEPARRPAPIDPVVFEVTDHARAQLDHVNDEDSDVWA